MKHFLVVGIGGGVPSYGQGQREHIVLGDVVVGVMQRGEGGVAYFESGAWEQWGLTQSSHTLHPSVVLRGAVNNLRSQYIGRAGSNIPQTLSRLRENLADQEQVEYSDPGPDHDYLFADNYHHADPAKLCDSCCDFSKAKLRHQRDTNLKREKDMPQIHYGTIGSSNALIIDSGKRNSLFKQLNIMCFEMESGGVVADHQALVIRGICDYADAQNKRWQKYAAATAAAYAKEVLSMISPVEITTDYSYQTGNAPMNRTWAADVSERDHQLVPGSGAKRQSAASETQKSISPGSPKPVKGISFVLEMTSSVFGFLDYGSELIDRYFDDYFPVKRHPLHDTDLEKNCQMLIDITTAACTKLADLQRGYPQHIKPLRYLVVDIWTKQNTEHWELMVNKIRHQVLLIVLICIWEEPRKPRNQVEATTKDGTASLKAEQQIAADMNSIRNELKVMSAGKGFESASTQEEIANLLWASLRLIDTDLLLGKFPTLSSSPFGSQQAMKSAPSFIPRPTPEQISKKILKSLEFEEMTYREETIPHQYPETFTWLFAGEKNTQDQPEEAQTFVQWLQSENDHAFWITGKPASGKSTLMKFISQHKQLQTHLSLWAGDKQPLIATTYFWKPGSKEQKSLNGLLRSLLCQCLKMRPDRCQLFPPSRWVFHYLMGLDSASPMWESTELRGCLERFLSKTKDKNRQVLLIDGLDEFDDDFQQDLVALLKKIQDCHSTKICVASRDWNLFRDAFHQGPSLRMDVLTRRDIDIYVEKRLETSQAFLELQKLHSENIRALLAEIRAKANGVFLWVVLVVEQLLLIARDDPRLETIRKVLNALPPDLERLYNQIQTSLTPEQKSTASKIYQLVMGWKRLWGVKMETTFLWLTLNLNERYDEFDVTSLMTRLLATYTKGIVQVGSSSRAVDFIHRTAFDWLRMESNWATICSQQPEEFVSSLDIVSVLVKHLRHVWNRFGNFVEVDEERITLVFRILRFAGDIPNTSRNRLRLLSILEQMETYQLLPLNKISPDQSLSVSDDMLRPHLAVYPAAWNCLPCLQAICESDPSTIHAKCFFAPFDSQSWRLEALSLLEVAIFGGPARIS
ncbi:P-loop containing nucleoside triphosphate hydrolase [Pochonia chlamydosporia 170]|uniref:P-loop containing nucleoside triphosphate hydrolase n=1 Tax=Pochonia chlamydosporia 170 TaxID=1380566 RepID=A0A179F3A9_METCM|nr:P-loop containing nucleoside triphosphate hydrolase [Pochonia chlamydosporia 170]OAQ59914.1 P-loop containing nucleoside triphosphate hydrolase [Pochonia chlamydosporia 170]